MSASKKLSHDIKWELIHVGEGHEAASFSLSQVRDWRDRARALEERVAELASELQQSGADWNSALVRAEAAEAEVVVLTAELQHARGVRKFVEDARDDWRNDAHTHQAEVARLRIDAEGNWSDYASASVRGLEKERDALRAKLDAVRSKMESEASRHERWTLQYGLAVDVIAMIDGEGDHMRLDERDALRVDAARVVKERDMFAADCTALRAKLDVTTARVRALPRIFGSVAHTDDLVADIIRILNGEGDE